MGSLPVEVAFLLGCVGAAAPEILRLYELRTKPEDFKWSWNYMFLTVPFLLLGGLVAVILPATTVWGAFYTGLSLPVTLSAAAKKVMDIPGLGQPVTADKATSASGAPAAAFPTAKATIPAPMQGFRAYVHALL
jgi:hypothetical protein